MTVAPDRHEVGLRRHVVVGEEEQVLELVELQAALSDDRVGLLVVGEILQFDIDAGRLGQPDERLPVRLAPVGDADLDGDRVFGVRSCGGASGDLPAT